MRKVKDFIIELSHFLFFISIFCMLGFFLGFGYGLSEIFVKNLFVPDKHEPVELIRIDTVTNVIYRDTSDSQFMKAILEIESSAYSKLALGKAVYPKVGDGGKAIGMFQMHESYFNCKMSQALGYKYEDMLRPDKSFHVFWAKMGIYADWYFKEHGELPTHEQLARMHNGSRYGHNKSSTIPYRNKYRKAYKSTLNGNIYNRIRKARVQRSSSK